MAIKQNINIEGLLIWAYRDQCADRYAARAMRLPSPRLATSSAMTMGCPIDGGGAATLHLPDDAAIIHDAVLGLGDIWIGWPAWDEAQVWDAERLASEGLHIRQDRAGRSWIMPEDGSDRLPPVRAENAGVSVVLITHARSGARPEWHDGWSPDLSPAPRRPRSRDITPDLVMHARAVYVVWRAALALLAAELTGALAAYEPIPPAAPESPWDERAKTVIRDLRPPRYSPHKALKTNEKKGI